MDKRWRDCPYNAVLLLETQRVMETIDMLAELLDLLADSAQACYRELDPTGHLRGPHKGRQIGEQQNCNQSWPRVPTRP